MAVEAAVAVAAVVAVGAVVAAGGLAATLRRAQSKGWDL